MLIRNEKLIDLIWSPFNDDEFVAYGNDIYLFNIKSNISYLNENLVKLGDEASAELVANFAENSNPKLVSWSLDKENQHLFAITLPNYKIQLINFNQNNVKKSNQKFQVQKEFSFKQIRQCTNLVWNPHQYNLIAAGFEKIRNEHSILVWDVRGSSYTASYKSELNTESVIYSTNYPSQVDSSSFTRAFNTMPTSLSSITISMNLGSSITSYNDPKLKQETMKPIYETGTSETCNSLAWHPTNLNQLLAGVNGKSLKIFDIRSTSKVSSSLNTKYVSNFSVDPINSCQAVSFADNVVAVWDIRYFDKPIHLITESEPIHKIQWCPTKSSKLAVLCKNSNTLNIYTIKTFNNSLNTSVIEDENAPIQVSVDKMSRKVSLNNNQIEKALSSNLANSQSISNESQLTNFSWYGFDTNKVLISSNYLVSNLKIICLFDTIALSWAPNGDFYWTSNLGKINLIKNLDKAEFEYLNEFKSRSKHDYGLKYDIININNGSATLTSSHLNGSTNSASSCQATPLALTFNSQNGLNSMIRSDFMFNLKHINLNNEIGFNLKCLWSWFESVNYLFEKTIPLNPRNNLIELSLNCRNSLAELYPLRYCGLKLLLNELEQLLKRPDSIEYRNTFQERFRVIAFNLCGWDIKDGNISKQFFNNLESSNQFERACCLALLTQNYEQALEILDSASKNDSRYGCLWIALKCFNEEQKTSDLTTVILSNQASVTSLDDFVSSPKNLSKQNSFNLNSSLESNKNMSSNQSSINESILKECNKLIEYFNNSYLKALFDYLINKDKAIMKALFDRNILFQDRVALSVHFMFDLNNLKQLQNYFDSLIENECIKYSDLNGILLTGLGPKSIDLFQSFIDKTGDIQTPSLAIIHTPYLDVFESNQVEYWINCYRDQLNKSKYWEKRAEFDILKMKLKKYQIMTYSPDYLSSQTQSSQSESLETNLSSSSSSSITSSNNVGALTPTHINKNPNQFYLANQTQSITNNLNKLVSIQTSNNIQKTSKSNLLFPNPTKSQSQHLVQQNLSVSLLCNKCGKNILDKPNSLLQNNQSSLVSLLNNTSNLTQFNEIHLNGCLNCANLLPQCVVCLKLMKINLIPNLALNSSNSSNSHLGGFGRTQSLYFQSPKITYNNYQQSKKLSIQYKSPNQAQNENSTNNNNNNNSRQFYLEDINENNQSGSNHSKKEDLLIDNNNNSNHKLENIHLLSNSKFGNWFSWCQTCHHGGHIKHLIDWFKHNHKCPYLHCKCNCVTLDFI